MYKRQTCCSWAPDRIDVFAKNKENKLIHIFFTDHWSNWREKESFLFSEPILSISKRKTIIISARVQPLEYAYQPLPNYTARRGIVKHFIYERPISPQDIYEENIQDFDGF